MRAFVVLLTDDPDAAEEKLKELAEKHGIENTPLTIFDGEAGPPKYKIRIMQLSAMLLKGQARF